MKILLVHGVSHCEADANYYEPWKAAITARLQEAGLTTEPTFSVLLYDQLFEKFSVSTLTYLTAVGELVRDGVWHSIADPLSGIFHSRGFGDDVRWSAGMVAQLCTENDLRRQLRNVLATALTADPPDVIAAHSLGTLITYDFLRNDPRGKTL